MLGEKLVDVERDVFAPKNYYNIARVLALYKSYWAAMNKIFIYARPCVNKMTCSAVFFVPFPKGVCKWRNLPGTARNRPEPPEPPGTNRNPPEPARNLPGTLKKAQMIKLKKKPNNKK